MPDLGPKVPRARLKGQRDAKTRRASSEALVHFIKAVAVKGAQLSKGRANHPCLDEDRESSIF